MKAGLVSVTFLSRSPEAVTRPAVENRLHDAPSSLRQDAITLLNHMNF